MKSIESSDDKVTPPEVYFNRRRWIQAAAFAGTTIGTAAIYRTLNPVATVTSNEEAVSGISSVEESRSDRIAKGWLVDEEPTTERNIVNYNNFYEFTTQKESVARVAAGFKTDDWKIDVDGLVNKPRTLSIDDLHAIGMPQERVYRMRCVEAWSMVIPWVGVPLARILESVEPTAKARFVAFETLYDPTRMPGQKTNVLKWPYVEGLRLDEAMHPLTLLATGLYGKKLPPQDGAPVRLVIPWKYGFKGIKSIVRISLVDTMPETSWNRYAPAEYGFFANVNPNVDHPRWSQKTEQRIGESGRRQTRMFNGYEDHVADLYRGMNLEKDF